MLQSKEGFSLIIRIVLWMGGIHWGGLSWAVLWDCRQQWNIHCILKLNKFLKGEKAMSWCLECIWRERKHKTGLKHASPLSALWVHSLCNMCFLALPVACEMTLNRSFGYFASLWSVCIILLEEDLLVYLSLAGKDKRQFFFPSFFLVSNTSVHSVVQVLLY